MKKYDFVSIIGTAICVIALALIYVWNVKHPAPKPAAPAVESVAAPAPVTSAESAVAPAAPAGAAVPSELSLPAPAEPVELAVPGEFKALRVDPTGLGIKGTVLEQYTVQTRDAGKRGDLLEMETQVKPFLALEAAGTVLYEAAAAEITERSVTTHRTDAQRTIAYDECWSVGEGGDAAHDYEVNYTLTVTNRSAVPVKVPQLSVDCGSLPSFLSTETNTSFSKTLSGSVAYGIPVKESAKLLQMKDVTKKMDAKHIALYRETSVSWLAVNSKYFMFLLKDLKLDGADAFFRGFEANSPAGLATERFHAAGLLPELTLQPGEQRVITITGYAGPKRYQRLQQMGQGIDSIMGMDLFFFWHFKWMGWICRILLESLNGIASWFPVEIAYGMGIILVTLIVKLIFMPLAWKSTRDMKKMAAVQPQLKALREKYKNDTQHLYYEQQKLFKENNVSQLGGCLPMLVQIPVFFAMFNTFRAAIEIRNAGFLWVADLSMPDPIFGLPIHPLALLTGVTMFIQQRMTPMPDPNQARMMNIMSLVFVVFFYNMPAGLTLYMTVNQLFSIGQMYFFRRWEKQAKKATA